MKILVTGATGYIGSRLIPLLLNKGYHVRAMGRSLEKLQSRSWSNSEQIELFEGDALERESIQKACDTCDKAYYLVHSMNKKSTSFEEADRCAALNMKAAANHANLQQLIYLGGLGNHHSELSSHLQSRDEVAQILKSGKTPSTVLRAAMIIGSGSASFEILRYLVDRLPIMITPVWVQTPVQPIAIHNVLQYLLGCLEIDSTLDKDFDIGGSEVLSYEKLMQIYAQEAYLSKRLCIRVPVLTPRLSSYWIHLVTPIPSYLARPLAEGLKNPVICHNHEIETLIPQELFSPRQAIRRALDRLNSLQIESHWSDAGEIPPVEWAWKDDPHWAGGTLFKDKRSIEIKAPQKEVWNSLLRIGGLSGWYYGDWLWKLRGLIDRFIGGVGLIRGRRHPCELRVGDALDFWRVHTLQIHQKFVLVAEMKMPGKAVLCFELDSTQEQTTRLTQTALFLPDGILGILYWYFVMPLHHFVFEGMLKGIAKRTRKKERFLENENNEEV